MTSVKQKVDEIFALWVRDNQTLEQLERLIVQAFEELESDYTRLLETHREGVEENSRLWVRVESGEAAAHTQGRAEAFEGAASLALEYSNENVDLYAAIRALSSPPPDNQCDGCKSGMPIENGIHRNGGRNHMCCTAGRYDPLPDTAHAIHIEDTCQKCHGPNVVWFAPSELWNKVQGENDIICPVCFIKLAEEQGLVPPSWEVKPEVVETRTDTAHAGVCRWTSQSSNDDYATGCGHYHRRLSWQNYCPGCGRPISLKQ